MTLTAGPPDTYRAIDEAPLLSNGEELSTGTTEALIKEAHRRRRRRRWLVSGLSLIVIGGTVIAGFVGLGGTAPSMTSTASGGGSLPGIPAASRQTSFPRVALGQGPTSIYFANADLGWIATGCSQYCYESSPAMARTDDGGRTWKQVPTPNIGTVPPSAVTWFYLGGQTQVRFISRERGWYSQAGELWTTGDGGSTWSRTNVSGLVTDLTGAGNSAWVLTTDCRSPFPLNCSQRRMLRWSQDHSTWLPVQKVFATGRGNPADIRLTPVGSSLYVSAAGGQYRVGASGTVTSVSNSCEPIPGLVGDQLVGLCNVGDDASFVRFAVSTDQGRRWTPTVGGPRLHQGDGTGTPRATWSGVSMTNGTGTVWYVVGGATLWRTTTSGKSWVRVYETQPGSTNELFPVVFASQTTGYMGDSGSDGTRLLRTTNGGLTWNPVVVKQ